jgi:hypothetical protein
MASAAADEAKQSRLLIAALHALAERSAFGAEGDATRISLARSKWHITVSPVLWWAAWAGLPVLLI